MKARLLAFLLSFVLCLSIFHLSILAGEIQQNPVINAKYLSGDLSISLSNLKGDFKISLRDNSGTPVVETMYRDRTFSDESVEKTVVFYEGSGIDKIPNLSESNWLNLTLVLTDFSTPKNTKEIPLAIKVTFDADGGTPIPVEKIVQYGKAVDEPSEAVAKAGNTFDGWYNGNDVWDFAADKVTKTLTLKAHWVPVVEDTFTVTFDAQNGDALDTVSVVSGDTLSEPADPLWNGYDFTGWYTQTTGGSKWVFTDPVTKGMTLYGQWKSVDPTNLDVVFDAQNGDATVTVPIASGGTLTEPADPVRDGYDFTGWYTQATGGSKWVFTDPVTQGMTLFGQWDQVAATTYPITFDSRGGEALDPVDKANFSDLPTPTKTDDEFIGWYLDADLTQPVPAGEPLTEAVTLFAKWQSDITDITNMVTITLDVDGGSISGARSFKIPSGSSISVSNPISNPYKSGYTFNSWIDTSTGLVWNLGAPVESDLNLKASWSAIRYSGGSSRDSSRSSDAALNPMPAKGSSSSSDNDDTTTLPTEETPAGSLVPTDQPTNWPSPFRFIDVADTDWFKDAVYFVYERNIFKGISDTEFGPNMTMTRGMFVTALGRTSELLGYNTSDFPKADFKDNLDGMWYTKYINWAIANGIADGYDNGLFGVNDPVTREQMAKIMVDYAAYANIALKEGTPKTFTDSNKVSLWAVDYVNKATAAGIINGYEDGSFKPQNTATRAEVATVFMNFLKAYTMK